MTEYPLAALTPQPAPPRRPGWVLPVIAALAVLLIAAGGLIAWMALDNRAKPAPALATTSAPAPTTMPALPPEVACRLAVPALVDASGEVVAYADGKPVDATKLEHALALMKPVEAAAPPQILQQLHSVITIGDRTATQTRAGTHEPIDTVVFGSAITYIARFCAAYATG